MFFIEEKAPSKKSPWTCLEHEQRAAKSRRWIGYIPPQHARWMRAEEMPGIRSVFYRWKSGHSTEMVRVVDFNMPIISMFIFMIKWVVISIPVILILFFALVIFGIFVIDNFSNHFLGIW